MNSIVTEPVAQLQAQGSILSSRVIRFVAIALFAVALGITTIRAAKHAESQFVGAHAFVSADVATTARTFAVEGFWKLHGVPVNNNPPIGPHDQYTHWPPLLPIILSGCFRLFGASEHTAHIFMLGILLATALLVFRLGWLWLGPIGGALAGYFWLTLPVVVQFGDLVAQQSLSMLFVVAALVAFSASRENLGAILLFFAVLSAWEAALVLPGIWFASRLLPEQRAAAAKASAAIVAGVSCIVGVFVLTSPELAADTIQTAKYYMGLSPVYSHTISHDRSESLTFIQQISGIIWNHLWMLGLLGSAAVVQLLATRPGNGTLLVSVLAAPWALWTVLMRSHIVIHHFELLIAAPLAALALAWVATAQLRMELSKRAVIKTSVFAGLAAIQLIVLPHPTKITEDYSPERLIRFSRAIRDATGSGAVVMTPSVSAISIYYSERHIIRGVGDSDALRNELPRVRREFPGARIYLAIPPFLSNNFAYPLTHETIISSNQDVIIVRL